MPGLSATAGASSRKLAAPAGSPRCPIPRRSAAIRAMIDRSGKWRSASANLFNIDSGLEKYSACDMIDSRGHEKCPSRPMLSNHGADREQCRNRRRPNVLRSRVRRSRKEEPMLYAILAYHIEDDVLSWTRDEDAVLTRA